MTSQYLSKLSREERNSLIKELWTIQKGKCFISGKDIDLDLHKEQLDIDHIIPLQNNGRDSKENFALTFSSANRSKQAADLNLARVICHYYDIVNLLQRTENRNPNLSDILSDVDGSKYELSLKRNDNFIHFTFSEIGNVDIQMLPIYKDKLSGLDYFFTLLPIEYVYHDDFINPRTIGANISKLLAEFYQGNPQLHVSLGWVNIDDNGHSQIKIFDGQHKAAAQVLLGVRQIPVRVFINPDKDKLIETNFRAGTTLKQVAFDKSIQRHLGNALYRDRVEHFQNKTERKEDDFSFSENDLINFYKGESREMKRYILDSIKDSITHNPDNKLKEFIDMGGRAKEKPLSYSTVEKTFYSFFIYNQALGTRIDAKLEEGLNPRELEKSQIVKLMNIIADRILIGKYDFDIGTYRIENRLQQGENIPWEHIIAYRMMKEEILYAWLGYISKVINTYFVNTGQIVDDDKLFESEFSSALWNNIDNFVQNLYNLPMWKNKEFSQTIFGGKQNYTFWKTIFQTGESQHGEKILVAPLNFIEMIKPV